MLVYCGWHSLFVAHCVFSVWRQICSQPATASAVFRWFMDEPGWMFAGIWPVFVDASFPVGNMTDMCVAIFHHIAKSADDDKQNKDICSAPDSNRGRISMMTPSRGISDANLSVFIAYFLAFCASFLVLLFRFRCLKYTLSISQWKVPNMRHFIVDPGVSWNLNCLPDD